LWARLWQRGWEWRRRNLRRMCLRGKSHKSQLRRTGCVQQIIPRTDLPCYFAPGGTHLFRNASACCPTLGGRNIPNSNGEQKSRHANATAQSPQRGTTKWTHQQHTLAQPRTRPSAQRSQINALTWFSNIKL
jgi:hypothetical protein